MLSLSLRTAASVAPLNAQAAAVRGKADAMNTAGMVHQAPGLAPAADQLWDPGAAFPMPPDQFTTAQ